MRTLLVCGTAALCLAAAAPPRAAEPIRLDTTLSERNIRLLTLTHRISVAARPYCTIGNVPVLGTRAGRRAYDEGEQAELVQGSPVGIVFAGSPAARAGVLPGDLIVSVDGRTLSRDKAGQKTVQDAVSAAYQAARPLPIGLVRDGKALEIAVRPYTICRHAALILLGDRTPVYGQLGGAALIPEGLFDRLPDEAALAFVVTRYLAAEIAPEARNAASCEQASSIFGVLLSLRGRNNYLFCDSPTGKVVGGAVDALTLIIVQRTGIALEPLNAFVRDWRDNPDKYRLRSAMGEMTAERADAIGRMIARLAERRAQGKPPTVAALAKEVNPEDLEGAERLYDVEAVPLVSRNGKEIYERFLANPKRPRAYAISARGAASASYGPNAAQEAKTRCEKHGSPCWLYAVDGQITWSAEDAAGALAARAALKGAKGPERDSEPPAQDESTAATLLPDAAGVPHIGASGRAIYEKFLASTRRPRAFALSPRGASAFSTGLNAAEQARANCEKHGTVCFVYALDDRVVWDGTLVIDTRLCDPARVDPRLCDIEAVPVRDEGKERYKAFLLILERPRAFVINDTGGWRFLSGPHATQRALDACSKTGARCRVYAEDDRVIEAAAGSAR